MRVWFIRGIFRLVNPFEFGANSLRRILIPRALSTKYARGLDIRFVYYVWCPLFVGVFASSMQPGYNLGDVCSQPHLLVYIHSVLASQYSRCSRHDLAHDFHFSFQIDRTLYEETINKINSFYEDAERVGARSYCENIVGCLTAYLSLLCVTPQYNKVCDF